MALQLGGLEEELGLEAATEEPAMEGEFELLEL
jgi:hypothetical protein